VRIGLEPPQVSEVGVKGPAAAFRNCACRRGLSGVPVLSTDRRGVPQEAASRSIDMAAVAPAAEALGMCCGTACIAFCLAAFVLI
jgi:hypothetical protein